MTRTMRKCLNLVSDDGKIQINWNEETHGGVFTNQFLTDFKYSKDQLAATKEKTKPTFNNQVHVEFIFSYGYPKLA